MNMDASIVMRQLTSVLVNVVVHAHNTSHPSSIITKEDTTKCGESAHEIGLESDGRLDTLGIGGPGEYSTSSHLVGLRVGD